MGDVLVCVLYVVVKVIVWPVKIVLKGVVFVVNLRPGVPCQKYCGNGVAKIACDDKQLAFCECDKCGNPITKCINTDKSCDARRRFLDENDFTDVIACLDNDKCAEVLSGYGYEGIGQIQSTQDRCNEYKECTDEVLKLFENAVAEVTVNVPSSSEDVCNGFYEYIDDGFARTFDQAQLFCEETFSSNLAMIETKEQYDCAVSTIGDGSAPWVALDSYSDSHNTRSEYFYDVEHISCGKPLTAVLCNYKDSVCVIDEIDFQAVSIPNHVDYNSKDIFAFSDSTVSIMAVIGFIGFVLFLLITYVFGCYYCVSGKKYKTKTKDMEQYDAVDVVDK
eukprot:426938_1